MSNSANLADQSVAILGLGLMGGSLALAMRGKCAVLLGIDPDPLARALAVQRGVVDRACEDPAELLPQASLVILAAPVRGIISLLNDLPNLHPGTAVVMDLGSTKAEIAAAMQTLPARFEPVAGHPMCGKEVGSLVNAEAALYRGAPFFLVELPNSTPRAVDLAVQLVEAVEARPMWLEASLHDRLAAATSHLPYLLANALAFNTPLEASALIGPGFRSTVRLAPASQLMMLDILITNQPNVLASLRSLRQALERLESALELGDFELLEEFLGQGALKYEALMRQAQKDQTA